MSDQTSEIRVILIEGQAYEKLASGALKPLQDLTRHDVLAALDDDAITARAFADHDALPMSDSDWATAVIIPEAKRPVALRIDGDVLDWFKAQGKGYQTRMNAVLRSYMEAKRKVG